MKLRVLYDVPTQQEVGNQPAAISPQPLLQKQQRQLPPNVSEQADQPAPITLEDTANPWETLRKDVVFTLMILFVM